MRTALRFCSAVLLVTLLFGTARSQWIELYATDDDSENGTGSNTPSVGVIKENTFVAIMSSYSATTGLQTENFMIPYVNADSSHGRLNFFGYGGYATGQYQFWYDGGFVQVQLDNANHLCAAPDSFVYVANNDPLHNILVFRLFGDTMITYPVPGTGIMPRVETGSNRIWAIALDKDGYVYVCNDTTSGKTDDIKIYPPLSQWADGGTTAPVRTVDLPDGIYKGLTVSPSGNQIFVSDYTGRKVLKYKGSIASGYTADAGFSFQLGANDSVFQADPHVAAHPMGLAYLSPNNIVAVASHIWRAGGTGYSYGRIYMLNANNGALISTDSTVSMIDVAAWNYQITGAYNDRKGQGTASGYTSTYDVKFDEKGYLYSQSYYGWTVEKWTFNGTLPSFTGVEPLGEMVPGAYRLEQNYPNPFNPKTVVSYQLSAVSNVKVAVYDLLGREVAVLVNEREGPGRYEITFDGSKLSSGTYICRMTAGEFAACRRMMLVK
jgi:hypothetical protein